MLPGDLGLLLSLPVDSIAVRAVLASLVALAAGRLLLSRGVLTVARVRAGAALLPPVALAVVLLASLPAPALPDVWVAVEATDGLTVRVADTYLDFAPAAAGLLLAAWAVVAGTLASVRLRRSHRTTRLARRAVDTAPVPHPTVLALVERCSARLGIPAPDVRVVAGLPGGALVLGVRRPRLVLDEVLLSRLDAAELEGVVAHELAHVSRRDNLVVAALQLVRDAFFFVPGSRWSIGRLLRERELAADARAVEVTGRPGALASGLLKVLDRAGPAQPSAACALLPEGTVVERVERLCAEPRGDERWRRGLEVGAVAASLGVALVAAVAVPAVVGDDGRREALAVMVTDVREETTPVEATAFRVWGGTVITPPAAGPAARPAEDPRAWTPAQLAHCAAATSDCDAPSPRATLTLRPPDARVVEDRRVREWRLDPVVASETRQVAVFWVQNLS